MEIRRLHSLKTTSSRRGAPSHVLFLAPPPRRASFILMRLSGVRYLCKGNGKCVIVIVAAAGLARFSALARLVARSPSQAPREQASEQLLQQNPSRLSSMDEEEEESKGQPAERPVATAMYIYHPPSALRPFVSSPRSKSTASAN